MSNIPIQIISTLFIIPLFISIYGAETYGAWISILSIVALFLFFDLGFGVPFTNEIKNGANDDFISSIFYLILILSIFAAFIFLQTANLVFGFFNLDIANEIYMYISIYIFLEIILGIFSCILNGKGYVASVNKIKLYGEVIYIVFLTGLIFFDFNISSFIYALIVKTIFNGLVLFYISFLRLKLFSFTNNLISKSNFLSFLKDISKYQTHRISEVIYQSADNLIIQYYLGAGSVTIYNITSKIAVLFTRTIAPKFTSTLYLFINKTHKSTFQKNYTLLESKFLRLGFIFFSITLIINEPIINYFYSTNEFGGFSLTVVFSLWVLAEYFFINSYTHVIAFKKYNTLMFSSLFEMITNLLLSLFLINNYGLIGVAFSTLIAKVIFSYIFYYRVFHYINNWKWGINTLKLIIKNIIFTCIVLILSIILSKSLSNSIFTIIAMLLTVTIFNLLIFDFKILIKKNLGLYEKFKLIILK
mgnify:FL=1